jgi:uncharacterized membrane protein YjjP (DUF1212 family)
MRTLATVLLILGLVAHSTTGNCALVATAPLQGAEAVIDQCTDISPVTTLDVPQESRKQLRKKLSFTQRIALKLIQKKARKAEAKSRADNTGEKRPLSTLAVIFGSIGLGVIFIPFLAAVAVPCAVAGIVLGILGIKREGANAMNILGIVFCGTLILVLAIVLLLFIALYLV